MVGYNTTAACGNVATGLLLRPCSQWPFACARWTFWTNWCLSSLSGIYIPQWLQIIDIKTALV